MQEARLYKEDSTLPQVFTLGHGAQLPPHAICATVLLTGHSSKSKSGTQWTHRLGAKVWSQTAQLHLQALHTQAV